jgi:hypothetical protein
VAKLGSFGAAVREIDPDSERDTFDFFDREFTVHAAIPPMLVLQLGAMMAGELGIIDSNAVVYKALRHALTVPGDDAAETLPDTSQFDLFEHLATKRRCSNDELIRLVYSLLGIQIAFPTEPQPTSPDGLPETGESSNSSASDTPDSRRLVSVDEVLAG